MDSDQIIRYAAMFGCAAFGLAATRLAYRYRQKHSPAIWVRQLHADIGKAAGDECFRQSELRETEAKMTELRPPIDSQPLTRAQEYYLQTVPGMLFLLVCGGAVLMFLGVFQGIIAGMRNWMSIAGPVLLAIAAVVCLAMRGGRRRYAYLQLLNKKFLLFKAGNELEKAIPVLKTLLEHYPSAPELWMEMADQLARTGKLDDALQAVNKAAELAPKHIDVAMMGLSLQLRRGALRQAREILATLPTYRTLPADPRQSLYAAALSLKENEAGKALAAAKKAIELDRAFTEKFVALDPALQDVALFLKEKKLVKSSPPELFDQPGLDAKQHG